jgi:cell division protein FtsA
VGVGRNGLITALDIGSTKVGCFIGRRETGGGVRVLGIGHQASNGVRAGTIIDMDAAEEAIRSAVHSAERMAGETPREVIVNVSGGKPQSHTVSVEVEIAGHAVGDADIRRVLTRARGERSAMSGEVLHSTPAYFSIDGNRGVANPRGMHGQRLGVSMHFLTVEPGPIRNLATVIDRCHLEVRRIVASPYASGLATLVEDETDLGVTLIDMGGGTTSIAVFAGGRLVHADVIPVGGNHVTNDIALGLATPGRHAERIKTLHGSAIASPNDDRRMISIPQLGDDGNEAAQEVPRNLLTGIIQPRIEETLELVRARIELSGLSRDAGRRAVLTGGACQLTGVRELAARILDKQIRIGKPIGIHGLAEATEGPAFATCAGLLTFVTRRPSDIEAVTSSEAGSGGRMARLSKWFRENF